MDKLILQENDNEVKHVEYELLKVNELGEYDIVIPDHILERAVESKFISTDEKLVYRLKFVAKAK